MISFDSNKEHKIHEDIDNFTKPTKKVFLRHVNQMKAWATDKKLVELMTPALSFIPEDRPSAYEMCSIILKEYPSLQDQQPPLALPRQTVMFPRITRSQSKFLDAYKEVDAYLHKTWDPHASGKGEYKYYKGNTNSNAKYAIRKLVRDRYLTDRGLPYSPSHKGLSDLANANFLILGAVWLFLENVDDGDIDVESILGCSIELMSGKKFRLIAEAAFSR